MPGKRKRRVEIEDLFRLRAIQDADISPDGERIVLALGRLDLKRNANYSSLYAVSRRGGPLRRLTRGDHVDSSPRFSPDGGTLAFLSDREKVSSVWLLPLAGGEPERLTDRDFAALDFAWSPDSRSLAVVLRRLTERERLERDGKRKELERRPHFRHVTRLHYMAGSGKFLTEERAHVHLVRVGGGGPVQLTRGDRDDLEPRFSPDGARVSFLSNRVEDPDLFIENLDIYSVGLDGKGLRKLTREPGAAFGHVWSPDGRSVIYVGYVGGPGEWDRRNLHVRRVAAGGGPSVDLTPDLDANAMNSVVGDVTPTFEGPAPAVSPDGSRVLFPVTEEGACRIRAVPVGGGDLETVIGGDRTVFRFGFAREAGAGFAVVGDLTNPADVYRLTLTPSGGDLRRITRVNDAVLRGLSVVTPEEVRFRRRGGSVHGWVLRPPGFRKGRKYPVVLQIHGGPHVAYGHVFFHEMQLLASRGYVVLMTNPRGSDGYGLDHRNAIHADWGNADSKDVLAALDALLRRGYVDPERQFVTGGSYGGYMTNWLVGHTNRFRAAVTQRSVVNLTSFFGTSDFGWYFRWDFDGTPWEAEERYRRLSPLTYAERVRTPLLIIHSEQDQRAPMGQAEELYTTLKFLGRDVELVRFVGECHELSRSGRPQNRAERLRRILDWFARH